MFDFLKDIGNYESRKIGRSKVNGLDISTAFSSDEGYETAIIDKNGVHPVERYKDKNEAIIGHQKWCEKAETLETIIELDGLMGMVPEREIKLIRKVETDIN